MKKTLIVLISVLVLIAVMVLAYFYIQRSPDTNEATVEQLEENERRAKLESVRERITERSVMTEEEKTEHEAKLQRFRSLQKTSSN